MLDFAFVQSLLADMESDRIERTTSVREDKLGPAVCAFANDFANTKQAGYILLGVKDNGEIAGNTWTDEDLQKIGNIKNNGNVLPQPSITVSEVFKFEQGEVVVVQVLPSPYPPVRYDGRCWIRIGPRRDKASVNEEAILIERRSAYAKTFDLVPALAASLDDLNVEYFKFSYLPAAIDKETLDENGRPVQQQLASLRFFDIQRNCPTHAGIIALAFNPKHFIPGCYIQYLKFDGDSLTSPLMFEKVFSGPLVTDLRLIDDFIKSNIVKERPVRGNSFQEHNLANYPYWALRELTMNAIMHRSYESNAPIYIYEFSNRIEIINPGALYGDVNVHNFPYASDYRNVVLAETMKTLGYVNRFNYGVQRAQEELAKNGNPSAVFDLGLITKFKVSVSIHPNWL